MWESARFRSAGAGPASAGAPGPQEGQQVGGIDVVVAVDIPDAGASDAAPVSQQHQQVRGVHIAIAIDILRARRGDLALVGVPVVVAVEADPVSCVLRIRLAVLVAVEELCRFIRANVLAKNPQLLNYRYIEKLAPGIQVMLVPNDNPYILPLPEVLP